MPRRPTGDNQRSRAVLVGLAQSGDRSALDQLLGELQQPLHAHIRVIVGNADAASDVLQDTLMLIARHLRSLRNPAWLGAWVYRIATREAVRRARRDQRDTTLFAPLSIDNDAPLEEDIASDDVADVDLLQALPALVNDLPPASQLVVRMHYIDGLPLQDVAAALEIPLGTVKSRLAYGLARLRRSIGARRSH